MFLLTIHSLSCTGLGGNASLRCGFGTLTNTLNPNTQPVGCVCVTGGHAQSHSPISGLTFLLVPKQAKDPAKQNVVKQFVQYVITQGQSSAESLQYSKLPESLAQQDQKLLEEIGGGQQASGNAPSQ